MKSIRIYCNSKPSNNSRPLNNKVVTEFKRMAPLINSKLNRAMFQTLQLYGLSVYAALHSIKIHHLNEW